MLAFHIICLCITLFVLEHYVITNFHAQTHRLLPLVLGLIALYNYYLIVEYFSDYDQVFVALKDLLLMQVVFLLLYYIMDFMRIKLPWHVNVIAFVWYTASNILVCSQINSNGRYRMLILFFIIAAVFITLIVCTIFYMRGPTSKAEKTTYLWLYISIVIPSIAVVLSIFGFLKEQVALPSALAVTCIIIDLLMAKGRLMDAEAVMKNDFFDTSEIPCLMFDRDLFFLDANKPARRNFPSIVENLNNDKASTKYIPYLKVWTDRPEQDNEVAYEDRYYNCILRPIYVKKKLRGYIIQIYDITNQKEQVKDKSNFLAYMSHDLRSPLHAIIGGSEIMLGRNEMSIRNRVMVQHIKNAGDNLLEIVNSILDYSKLEAGKLTLTADKYSFRKMLTEQNYITNVNLTSKPIDFSMEIMTDYPEYLIGDELRVREVIQNILSNAVKYTKRGSITCKVWVDTRGKDCFIKVEVKDTGIGIAKDVQKSILKEYATATGGTIKESTGLGLSIINQLVHMMGGSIELESDGKTGTTVTAWFHQEAVTDRILSPELIKNSNIGDSLASWTEKITPDWVYPKAKILLADDMQVNREIFQEYANFWQIKIDAAEDGKEALEFVQQQEYDLVVLDIMMPVMDGNQAAEEIRKISNVPIISLSANEVTNPIFTDGIDKPIRLVQLKKIFEKYLAKELRVNPPIVDEQMIFPGGGTTMEAYIRTLRTYVSEISSILEELRNYMDTDIDMFRTKVHGIKGISRQLGKLDIAEAAEIMEMASKAGHIDYIRSHIDEFCESLKIILDEAKKEIEDSSLETADDQNNNDKIFRDEEKILGLKGQIKEAFESYDSIEVEKLLAELSKYALTDQEKELLSKARAAVEAFEYEDGIRLFE